MTADKDALLREFNKFNSKKKRKQFVCAAIGCRIKVIRKKGICAWCRLDSGRRA